MLPILDIGLFSWQNYVMRWKVCFVRGSADYIGTSDHRAGWLYGRMPPALARWEARRGYAVEEDLSRLGLSGDGGLMALNDLVFHSSGLCCFFPQEKREDAENWAGRGKGKSLLPMQVLDLPLKIRWRSLGLCSHPKKYMQWKVVLLCQLAKTLWFLRML